MTARSRHAEGTRAPQSRPPLVLPGAVGIELRAPRPPRAPLLLPRAPATRHAASPRRAAAQAMRAPPPALHLGTGEQAMRPTCAAAAVHRQAGPQRSTLAHVSQAPLRWVRVCPWPAAHLRS